MHKVNIRRVYTKTRCVTYPPNMSSSIPLHNETVKNNTLKPRSKSALSMSVFALILIAVLAPAQAQSAPDDSHPINCTGSSKALYGFYNAGR